MIATVEDQLFTVMKLLFLDTLKLFKKGIFDTFNTRTLPSPIRKHHHVVQDKNQDCKAWERVAESISGGAFLKLQDWYNRR